MQLDRRPPKHNPFRTTFALEPLEPRLQLSTSGTLLLPPPIDINSNPSIGASAKLPDLTPWISRGKQYVYGWSLDSNEQPGHLLLRLTTAMANIGAGPMELRGGATHGSAGQDVYQRIYNSDGTHTDILAGTFVYHPSHHHFHFNDFALYQLREDLPDGTPGQVIASGRKTSFCLTDSDEYDTNLPDSPVDGSYYSCSTKKQGISVGWADVYTQSLADQWIDVTNVPNGKYFLEVTVDPANHLMESNENNNSAHIEINLKKPTKPRNDDFANRSVLQGKSATGRANTTDASNELGEPDHANVLGGASVWWTWTAPDNGKVIITTKGSTFDTVLGVYTGLDLSSLDPIAGNDDDSHGGHTSRVLFQAIKGTTYQIAVDGYRGATGQVKLTLSEGP